MALDFYEIGDIRLTKRLFSLDDKQLDTLNDAFIELEKITGNYIDPYGTNRIYQEHVEIILTFIKSRLSIDREKKTIQSHFEMVEEFSGKARNGLLAVGD